MKPSATGKGNFGHQAGGRTVKNVSYFFYLLNVFFLIEFGLDS